VKRTILYRNFPERYEGRLLYREQAGDIIQVLLISLKAEAFTAALPFSTYLYIVSTYRSKKQEKISIVIISKT
jgi:hypothetical protein